MRAFKGKIGRIHALRKLGVKAANIARAAGTSAITYGAEVAGMSDSHLLQARRLIARASAPEGGGKDPNLVLYVVDGLTGSCDPAFGAHVLPVVRYASAWWEGWQKATAITAAMTRALERMRAKGHRWACVNGPISTLIMSLAMMKWVIVSPSTLSDDLGNIFNLQLDPPCILAEAVKALVRRWRIAQIIVKYLGCCPSKPDYIDPRLDEQMIRDGGLLPHGLVDLVGPMSRMGKSLCKSTKQFEPWSSKHAPSLISASTGGQWCQARVASTKAWTDDARCQLCLQETGTLLHRRTCSETLPCGGWPAPKAEAGKGMARLYGRRHAVALERGIIFPIIMVHPLQVEHSLAWIIKPPDVIPAGARWYTDGCCTHPTWKHARGVGFALVLADSDGSLMAAGNGNPPYWVTDSVGRKRGLPPGALHVPILQ